MVTNTMMLVIIEAYGWFFMKNLVLKLHPNVKWVIELAQ
jgi:hypothetical protein